MAGIKKARKRKAVRYKTLTLTLTARQKKSLVNYCKSRRTTPTKLIKKSIRHYLDQYADLKVEPVRREKVNQLELF